MYEFNNIDSYRIERRGKCFAVAMPFSCPRDGAEVLKRLGAEVRIDGNVYRPIAVEMKMPGTPIAEGEVVGLLVGRPTDTSESTEPP